MSRPVPALEMRQETTAHRSTEIRLAFSVYHHQSFYSMAFYLAWLGTAGDSTLETILLRCGLGSWPLLETLSLEATLAFCLQCSPLLV